MNNKSKLALAACAVGFSAAAAAAPEVDVFSPQGEAKGVRQVAVRFTEAMVAFGDPRLPDPFDVKCEGDAAKLKGTGRWADARNWAYDFEADLPAGQKCTFTLKQGGRQFQFHTGGPAVMTSLPREGDERIDDEQWFLLAFDAPVDGRASSATAGARRAASTRRSRSSSSRRARRRSSSRRTRSAPSTSTTSTSR